MVGRIAVHARQIGPLTPWNYPDWSGVRIRGGGIKTDIRLLSTRWRLIEILHELFFFLGKGVHCYPRKQCCTESVMNEVERQLENSNEIQFKFLNFQQ